MSVLLLSAVVGGLINDEEGGCFLDFRGRPLVGCSSATTSEIVSELCKLVDEPF